MNAETQETLHKKPNQKQTNQPTQPHKTTTQQQQNNTTKLYLPILQDISSLNDELEIYM